MIEVLLIGTYHMGNPGADLVNLTADDVRSPQRQAELASLTHRIGDFSPTKVLVEWSGDTPSGTISAFRTYTPQSLLDDPNEVVQLGFRLAAQQQHTDVFGIDVPGEFPFEAVQEKAEKAGRLDELTALLEELQNRVQQHQRLLETHSIAHYLQ